MPTRYSVVFDDSRAREIHTIACEYDLTEEEALRQLVEMGLEELDEKQRV